MPLKKDAARTSLAQSPGCVGWGSHGSDHNGAGPAVTQADLVVVRQSDKNVVLDRFGDMAEATYLGADCHGVEDRTRKHRVGVGRRSDAEVGALRGHGRRRGRIDQDHQGGRCAVGTDGQAGVARHAVRLQVHAEAEDLVVDAEAGALHGHHQPIGQSVIRRARNQLHGADRWGDADGIPRQRDRRCVADTLFRYSLRARRKGDSASQNNEAVTPSENSGSHRNPFPLLFSGTHFCSKYATAKLRVKVTVHLVKC